jgi:predicted nucleic acid-binding protein
LKEVLDSRFLIEYLYSPSTETKKKTQRKLKELVQRKEGLLPTIVISEITKVVCENMGKELMPPLAKQAGLLKCQYKKVPIGDCVIAATAIENHAQVLTDDPHFDQIKETKRTWL